MGADVTCINESRHLYRYAQSVSHVTCIGMFSGMVPIAAYLYMWRDSFTHVTWLVHMCDVTHAYMWRDSCICVTWLIHMCNMTHSYVCRDSFVHVTRLIHMCDVTHSYMWHDSFICVTWLIHMCDKTVWTSHIPCMNKSCPMYERVKVPYINESLSHLLKNGEIALRMHCNTLQHTATHHISGVLQCVAVCCSAFPTPRTGQFPTI